ncbi:MAG: adenine deaminase [Spirochaetia bacterium]|jgi:adenine deaminase|nr:adenine deaminase [Spirochaetia bacterium]
MTILLKNGNTVDVENTKITRADILIENGIITEVSEKPVVPPADAEIIDCAGKIVSPGLIDAHLHIESSMLSPVEFCRNSVKNGTTAVLADPHEISNVFGMDAVKMFMELAPSMPLQMLIALPSCVPSTDMENSGAAISLADMREIMDDPGIYGLGEMMNFPGIINGFGEARQKVDAFFELGKLVDGHSPSLRGKELISYITNGRMDGKVRIMSDHEVSFPEEALEKIANGMYIALRYGSASKDMDNVLPGILRSGAGTSKCMLCSDDLSAQELYDAGHMNRTVRRCRDIIAETLGVPAEQAAVTAIGMASKNAGNYLAPYLAHYGLPRMGVIAKGMRADITVFDSLEKLNAIDVICGGKITLRNSLPARALPSYDFKNFTASVNLRSPVKPGDFSIHSDKSSVRARAIDITAESLLTGTCFVNLLVQNGIVRPDPKQDTAIIAVFERHHATGSHAAAFVRGLGIKEGAMASTVAHDSHNLIVAGYEPEEMAVLANALMDCGGGIGVIKHGKINLLPLEIGGLMSNDSIETVIAKYKAVKDELSGSRLKNAFMTMSFLSLPVIPELKITDKGLVDVNKFEFVSVIEE